MRYKALYLKSVFYLCQNQRIRPGYGVIAVSYTHLDVYKRQGMPFGAIIHKIARPIVVSVNVVFSSLQPVNTNADAIAVIANKFFNFMFFP